MSRLTKIIGYKLTDAEYQAAQRVAEEESRTLSSVSRVALREYLARRGNDPALTRDREQERAA